MDVLTWYLQGFVGILFQGGEVQNDAKLCFSSTEASRSSRSCYVGRRTGICIPTDGGNDFIISVFQGIRHIFLKPHPKKNKYIYIYTFTKNVTIMVDMIYTNIYDIYDVNTHVYMMYMIYVICMTHVI